MEAEVQFLILPNLLVALSKQTHFVGYISVWHHLLERDDYRMEL